MIISRRTLLVSTVAGLVTPRRLIGELFGPEVPPDLLILHTNDVHGHVEGRLAFLAHEIRTQRKASVPSLTLDAGDIVHGTPMEQIHGPGPVIGAFNAIGFDAATAGNHEFDFGPENFLHAQRLAKFPFLSANVRTASGDPWGNLKPYTIVQRGRLRIGIFGLTTIDTPGIEWPRTIHGIDFRSPFEDARVCVKELRGHRVDLVVALSHLGYSQDRKLAHEAPGIDLIIGGHSHTRLAQAVYENGIPIVQTGAYGAALGRIEVRFDGKTPKFDYRLIEVADCGGLDAEVGTEYEPLATKLKSELDEELTSLVEPMVFDKLESRETPAGKFLAACVQKAHGVSVGMFSSSQIQGTLDAGVVRRKDVFRVMGAYTRQHIVRCEVTGELLAREVARANHGGSIRVQVAGKTTGSGLVAGPAHVIQDMFLGKPGCKIVYDDPLGPNVRDAVIQGLKTGLYREFLATAVKQ